MSTIVFPPCPHEDCTYPGHHWHVDGLSISDGHTEESCTDPWSRDNPPGCVSGWREAPPEPESSARLVIPEITDEEVEACFQEAWKRVPVGATIPAGVRYRCEYAESGDARETTRLTARLVPGEDAYFVRASDWGKVILPEPGPDEGERLVEALARRLRETWRSSHRPLDALPAYTRSFWLSPARKIIAGLEDDGFTIEPKPRREAS